MGARELLHELAGAGLTVTADGDRLMIRPATKLTDDMRGALRAAKPELLKLLTRPYRLARDEADRCHADGWSDAEIAAFTARVTLFMRRGVSATDADDLAERLTLRDRDGDARRMCIECSNYRPGRCGDHKRAGLHTAELGRDLAALLQRCPGFQPSR
jgi:virulence-associated protein VagC